MQPFIPRSLIHESNQFLVAATGVFFSSSSHHLPCCLPTKDTLCAESLSRLASPASRLSPSRLRCALADFAAAQTDMTITSPFSAHSSDDSTRRAGKREQRDDKQGRQPHNIGGNLAVNRWGSLQINCRRETQEISSVNEK